MEEEANKNTTAEKELSAGELKMQEYAERVRDLSDVAATKELEKESVPEVFIEGVLKQRKVEREEMGLEITDSSDVHMFELIPPKYYGLNSAELKNTWEIENTGDFDQYGRQLAVKELVIDLMRERERRVDNLNRRAKARGDLRNLTEEVSDEEGEIDEIPNSIDSRTIPDNELFRAGELNTSGIEIVQFNDDHGQDSFSFRSSSERDVLVVCDGAGSYEKSGFVSSKMSEEIANLAEKGIPLSEIFERHMEEILKRISNSDEYMDYINEHPDRRQRKGEGMATALAVNIDKEKREIDYASIGDSPLMIIDRDPDGKIISFEIVNEGEEVNDTNCHGVDLTEELSNPSTYLIGIQGENSEVSTKYLKEKHKVGKIEFKKGRTLVLASDFLTKMLINSPLALRTKAEDRKKNGRSEMIVNAFNNLADDIENQFPEMWYQKEDGSMQLDPLFFTKVSTERLSEILIGIRNANNMICDDATMVAVSLDKI